MQKLKKCAKNCTHDFQDETYGKGMRIHTSSGECTVCGKSKYENLWSDKDLPHLACRFIPHGMRKVLSWV